ncbi:MAG: CBS domain-containing protein [Planctomycetes bacterium]|nr:CBS domain-containing protein [Planctomycetota bacterium]
MKVQEAMTRSPATCLLQDSLHAAAQKLWEHDCGCLPVVDRDGRALAMLTDRDVCMAAWSTGQPLHELAVSTAMSRQVVGCRTNEDVAAVAARMAKHGLRRLPVLDHDGLLVGILSLADLARLAAREPAPASRAAADAMKVLQAVAAARPSTPAATELPLELPHPGPAVTAPKVATQAAAPA